MIKKLDLVSGNDFTYGGDAGGVSFAIGYCAAEMAKQWSGHKRPKEQTCCNKRKFVFGNHGVFLFVG